MISIYFVKINETHAEREILATEDMFIKIMTSKIIKFLRALSKLSSTSPIKVFWKVIVYILVSQTYFRNLVCKFDIQKIFTLYYAIILNYGLRLSSRFNN